MLTETDLIISEDQPLMLSERPCCSHSNPNYSDPSSQVQPTRTKNFLISSENRSISSENNSICQITAEEKNAFSMNLHEAKDVAAATENRLALSQETKKIIDHGTTTTENKTFPDDEDQQKQNSPSIVMETVDENEFLPLLPRETTSIVPMASSAVLPVTIGDIY